MNNFETYKTMVASTAHCEEDDIKYLLYGFKDSPAKFPTVIDYEYGLKIYVASEFLLDELSSLKVSEGLKLIIIFAISSNCKWVDLDSDGPIYDKFPQYDW